MGKAAVLQQSFHNVPFSPPMGLMPSTNFFAANAEFFLAGHDNPKISLHKEGARVFCMLMTMAELGLRTPE